MMEILLLMLAALLAVSAIVGRDLYRPHGIDSGISND
jgi:hypothetical protein